jgi:hypothetical protein
MYPTVPIFLVQRACSLVRSQQQVAHLPRYCYCQKERFLLTQKDDHRRQSRYKFAERVDTPIALGLVS